MGKQSRLLQMENEINNRNKHCYNISFIILLSFIASVTLAHAIFFVYLVIYLKDNANALLVRVMSDVENKIVILSNDISKRLQDEMAKQFIPLSNQITILTAQCACKVAE